MLLPDQSDKVCLETGIGSKESGYLQFTKASPAPLRKQDPLERASEGSLELGKTAAELIIRRVGEDKEREGLRETPLRFARAMRDLCSGYSKSLVEVIGNGVFQAEGRGLVAVKSIEFFSLCEHHMLPFWGHVSVAYYPDQKILGLSKIARIVELYAKRLQVQERLTKEIAEAVLETISPRAVGVHVQAAHTCMMMRGVEKQASQTVTEYFEKVESLGSLDRERLLNSLGRS